MPQGTHATGDAHLRDHADVHSQALRWRLVLQALRPLYEADAAGQGSAHLQAAEVILAAQPVQVKVVHSRPCTVLVTLMSLADRTAKSWPLTMFITFCSFMQGPPILAML